MRITLVRIQIGSTLKHIKIGSISVILGMLLFMHGLCFVPFFSGLQCRKRKLKVSVVAVPKTIDNDILFMDKTFGFDTAVEEAQRAINSAYIEVSCITPSCGFQNAVK